MRGGEGERERKREKERGRERKREGEREREGERGREREKGEILRASKCLFTLFIKGKIDILL